ncbi:MAG: hypothetical protein ABL986_20080 [Vicinamibacterales bacterium]
MFRQRSKAEMQTPTGVMLIDLRPAAEEHQESAIWYYAEPFEAAEGNVYFPIETVRKEFLRTSCDAVTIPASATPAN